MALKNTTKLGIFGGGQLSQMLAEAALDLGLKPTVFVDTPVGPVADSVKVPLFIGDMRDPRMIAEFLDQVELVVFENEFLSEQFLEVAATRKHVRFLPDLSAIWSCSDKLLQKKILEECNIPHPRFVVVKTGAAHTRDIEAMSAEFGHGMVFKWSRLGYDGNGVYVLPSGRYEANGFADAAAFVENAHAKGVEVFVEELITFSKELALVATRSLSGDDIKFYPLVITQQVNGRCAEVWGRATNFAISAQVEATLQGYVAQIGERMNLCGTYAVEFFLDTAQHVYVNEIAPRVHNSGHFSQDAAQTSQFTNHWLAVLGEELGATETSPYFGMINLLGPNYYNGPSRPFTKEAEGIRAHWYYKQQSSPGRKLGHVNITAQTRAEFDEKRQLAKTLCAAWQAEHKGHADDK